MHLAYSKNLGQSTRRLLMDSSSTVSCWSLAEKNIHLWLALMVQPFKLFVANFLAESVVNLSRPFMGSVLDKFELYGTRKENWIPKLVKKLPADQLPPDFGGNKNHEPVYAFPWSPFKFTSLLLWQVTFWVWMCGIFMKPKELMKVNASSVLAPSRTLLFRFKLGFKFL